MQIGWQFYDVYKGFLGHNSYYDCNGNFVWLSLWINDEL